MGRLCVFVTLVAVLVAVARESTAAGAGRAFPVESENYVTERFHTINSRLEWDESNFLVDLSGLYANCGWLGRTGPTDVDRLTPDGVTITGVVDSTPGARADIDAVNDYIKTVVDRWVSEGRYNGQIRTAQRFGCSVRPGCSSNAVIGCLFSPGGFNGQNDEEESNDQPGNIVEGDQRGLAFTPEQYLVAERFTGTTWDRSHLLENLSGFETSCSMLAVPEGEWPFTRIRSMEQELGYSISHEYGYSPNLGSTDEALVNIIGKFHKIRSAQFIGCSIIPDCIAADRIMYAVVSCLYHN